MNDNTSIYASFIALVFIFIGFCFYTLNYQLDIEITERKKAQAELFTIISEFDDIRMENR